MIKTTQLIPALLWALCLILPMGCGGEEEVKEDPKLFVFGASGTEVSSLSFGADGGVQQLKLMTNQDWTLSGTPDWLTATPGSGKAGPAQISLSAKANEDPQARDCSVKISAGTLDKELRISQLAGTATGKDNPDYPVADLLDIEFLSDGTAIDRSASRLGVATYPGSAMVNYRSSKYSKYIAHFNHSLGEAASEGYFRIDYESSPKMEAGLADGHSLEVVFKADELSGGTKEIKMFSSMQQGGTGFLISKSSNGTQLTFLPNVSTTGSSNWIWTGSGINPQPGRYYHAVGVWNKEKGETAIYVDGVLKGTQKAPGNYIPPVASCHWFGVGADASTSGGDSAWHGDVAVARVYDKPLTAKEVKALYEAVEVEQDTDPIILSGISYLSPCQLKEGYKYHIYANGLKQGDVVRLEPLDFEGKSFDCETAVSSDCAKMTVPADFATGTYRILITRGGSTYPVGSAKIEVSDNPAPVGATEIVAHRGYHTTGHPENSIAALRAAQNLGIYAAEFDTWITTDGVVVVNHNATIPTDPGKNTIQNSKYEAIKDVTLANGEKVPTLEDYLEQGKKDPMKLVLEIKSHADKAKNDRVVDSCLAKVRRAKMDDQVIYIAFSYDNCKRIRTARPDAIVQYLNGDKAPSVVKADGISGIDYSAANFASHPTWIEDARKIGVLVNVWTVNSTSAMSSYISQGVDFLTTDYPQEAKKLLSRKYVTKE